MTKRIIAEASQLASAIRVGLVLLFEHFKQLLGQMAQERNTHCLVPYKLDTLETESERE